MPINAKTTKTAMLMLSIRPLCSLKMKANIKVMNDATDIDTGISPVPTAFFEKKNDENAMITQTDVRSIFMNKPSVIKFKYMNITGKP